MHVFCTVYIAFKTVMTSLILKIVVRTVNKCPLVKILEIRGAVFDSYPFFPESDI